MLSGHLPHRTRRPAQQGFCGAPNELTEHGRAPDAGVAQWQDRLEPLWKPLAGGCHLTRPVGASLRRAGFAVEPLGQAYLKQAPKVLGWMVLAVRVCV